MNLYIFQKLNEEKIMTAINNDGLAPIKGYGTTNGNSSAVNQQPTSSSVMIKGTKGKAICYDYSCGECAKFSIVATIGCLAGGFLGSAFSATGCLGATSAAKTAGWTLGSATAGGTIGACGRLFCT